MTHECVESYIRIRDVNPSADDWNTRALLDFSGWILNLLETNQSLFFNELFLKVKVKDRKVIDSQR